jgi:hypothetical protein
MIDVRRVHFEIFFIPPYVSVYLFDCRTLFTTAAKLDLFPSSVVTKTIHDNVLQPNKFIAIKFLNKQSTKLFVCFFGIFVSYLIFGIVQESM